MPDYTTTRGFFPNSEACIVHQTGDLLSEPSKGVEVLIHTRADNSSPYSAEIISDEHYADIGLTFEGNELVDFDGAF